MKHESFLKRGVFYQDIMSKQSEAKTKQGYVPKALPRTCGTCDHFLSDSETKVNSWSESWKEETNLRCGLGGFKVMKMATCNLWESKQ